MELISLYWKVHPTIEWNGLNIVQDLAKKLFAGFSKNILFAAEVFSKWIWKLWQLFQATIKQFFCVNFAGGPPISMQFNIEHPCSEPLSCSYYRQKQQWYITTILLIIALSVDNCCVTIRESSCSVFLFWKVVNLRFKIYFLPLPAL